MIIFDCDGVLVDSEILSNSIDAHLMSEAGHSITAEALIRGYIGQTKAAIWAQIAEERQVQWPDGLLQKAEALLLQSIGTDLLPVDGVVDALAKIEGRKAVASSSSPVKLRLALETTGLLSYFEPNVFSASQVERGKPAPDVFLFAARQCGADPRACTVIEDSVAGVCAGRAAGMRVLGFTGGRHSYPGHAEALTNAGAESIVTRMRDLDSVLRRMEKVRQDT